MTFVVVNPYYVEPEFLEQKEFNIHTNIKEIVPSSFKIIVHGMKRNSVYFEKYYSLQIIPDHGKYVDIIYK